MFGNSHIKQNNSDTKSLIFLLPKPQVRAAPKSGPWISTPEGILKSQEPYLIETPITRAFYYEDT